MHDYLIAIIQGIVEGVTEFLPVSSTGHQVLIGGLLGFTGDKAATFEIVIQLGEILAVAVIYWGRLVSLLGIGAVQWADGDTHPQQKMNLIHVMIACLPASVLGLVFHSFIKTYLFSPYSVLAGLVLGGVFMLYGEKKQPVVQAENTDQISYKQALSIGLFQCLSLWPGFSRSGATIAGGMLSGTSYKASTNFSFLIAVPMLVAASGYEMLMSYNTLTPADTGFFLTGFVVPFVVAVLAAVTFLNLLDKLKLSPFVYYRFGLAVVFLAYLLLR